MNELTRSATDVPERASIESNADSGPGASLRIEPPGRVAHIDWAELWSYRELLYFFVWRDIKVRYKQTVLGVLWAVLQPVLTMAVFAVFFGRLGGMSEHVAEAYPVFVFAGILPWGFFATAVTQASNSMVGSSHLLSKVYFPRLLIPTAAVLGGLLDFAIAFAVLVALMMGYGIAPTASLLAAPLFAAMAIVTAAGVGIVLAALVVSYRDFRYVTGFLLQLWMFSSPVVYPLDVIPESFRMIYALNPMVGILSAFRSSVLGRPFETEVILVSFGASSALFYLGVRYFLRAQRRFADII